MVDTKSAPVRPPAFDLQAHLFSSLLQGHTADVSLVVRGSWEAVYKLHRVVLIQAVCRTESSTGHMAEQFRMQGFFHSLFQSSGFSETRRSYRDGNELEVIFDDPNITRPAFEYVYSQIMSSHPVLTSLKDLYFTTLWRRTSFAHRPRDYTIFDPSPYDGIPDGVVEGLYSRRTSSGIPTVSPVPHRHRCVPIPS